jgi:dTDP-glucose 4,6-dehydratase
MAGPEGGDRVIASDIEAVLEACAEDLEALSGRRMLVSGGSGAIARHLVEAVLASNALETRAPAVLILPSRRPQELRGRYPKAAAEGWIETVPWGPGMTLEIDSPVDYVVHAASPVSSAASGAQAGAALRDMGLMAVELAKLAERKGAERVQLVSSGAVYADRSARPGEPFRESERSISAYADGKRFGEAVFRYGAVGSRIARPFSVMSPYIDLGGGFALSDFIGQASAGGPVVVHGDGAPKRNFIYASDLTIVLLGQLLRENAEDVINVGDAESTVSIAQLADEVASLFGCEVEMDAGDAERPSLSPSSEYVPALEGMLSIWRPKVHWREGLVRTCLSLQARNLIRPARPVRGGAP